MKLYNLIWTRTLESCMSNALLTTIQPTITAFDSNQFSYYSEEIIFPGWKIVENKYEKESSTYKYLMNIKKGSVIEYKKIESLIKMKETKSHLTEARLVHLLEENGIGRPSTFCSLVDKIQEREYVEKKHIEGNKIECKEFVLVEDVLTEQNVTKVFGNEKNKLVISQLGVLVIEFLMKHFEDVFDYKYTQEMEHELDLIASSTSNSLDKLSVCKKCNDSILKKIAVLKGENNVVQKREFKIDENHTYMIGKYGPVIKYQVPTNKEKIEFKKVKKTFDVSKFEKEETRTIIKLEDLLDDSGPRSIILGKYKNETLYLKDGKYGCYVEWGSNKTSLKDLDIPIEKIKYEDVLLFLEKDNLLDPKKPVGLVREINKSTSIRNGKYGAYIFYKNSKMKNPKFFKLDNFKHDYLKCPKEVLQTWLKETYSIE